MAQGHVKVPLVGFGEAKPPRKFPLWRLSCGKAARQPPEKWGCEGRCPSRSRLWLGPAYGQCLGHRHLRQASRMYLYCAVDARPIANQDDAWKYHSIFV